MDNIIKSAREIAMEKVEKLGEATEEERLGWKFIPQGESLAAKYMGEGNNLLAEMGKFEETEKKYIISGASSVLIRNINMPRAESDKQNNRKSMDGLKLLKNDKVGVENVFSKIRQLFTHYSEQGEQQKQQAYQSLKADMTAKIQQAIQQQTGSMAGTGIDVEKQPQFQQEWRKVQTQLESAYLTHLNDYKRELSGIL